MQRHRPSRYYRYSIEGDDSGRDLRIFLSSLIIGICIGAFGVYFWIEQPYNRQLAMVRAELNTALNRANSCTGDQGIAPGLREQLEGQLSSCQTELSRAQRDVSNPPVPKPPPGREAELGSSPTGAAAEAALALPVTPAPPATPPPAEQPPEPVAEIVLPAPPESFTAPASWPTLPRPRPDQAVTTPTPAATTPSPPPPEPAATPTEPASPAVWPSSFPPQPRARPTPPPAPPLLPQQQASAAPASTQARTALRGTEQVTLNVGEERNIGNGHQLRLIAVSRRNSGRYCVVAGNGLNSVRVASGGSARGTWGGQRVVLNASAQDGDTCRITVRPQ